MISQILKDKVIAYYKERVAFAQEHYQNHPINKFNVLRPFKLEFNNRKSSIGYCDYAKRTIFLSEFHFQTMYWEGIADTINHELAHWVEHRDTHGPYWQEAAIAMGASSSRTSGSDKFEKPWLMMFGDEIAYQCDEYDRQHTAYWIVGRKKETRCKLTMKRNPKVIDNSTYGE